MRYLANFIIILFITIPLYAQRDTLVTTNNQVIAGEIKKLSKGIVQIETDYSDSDFLIEWKKIKEINSRHRFTIMLTNGLRLLGTLNGTSDSLLIVTINNERIITHTEHVVSFNEFKDKLFERFSASLGFGFNITKANNLRQLNLRSSVGYFSKNWKSSTSLDVVLSEQDSIDQTRRLDGNLSYTYFLKSEWFVAFASDFLKNDEQKLQLRATPKVGIGNYIIQTNQAYLSIGGGIAWNIEYYTNSLTDERNNAEAFFNTELNMFDYDDFSILTTLAAYKSLAMGNRIRTDFKLDIKYDLPFDFYIKLGYTYNYDSQPIEGAATNDYVLKTTLGWEL